MDREYYLDQWCLTEFERDAIDDDVNLSDGHARHLATGFESRLRQRLGNIYLRAERTPYGILESYFLRAYSVQSGQASLVNYAESVTIHPSASISIEIVANLLRRLGKEEGRPCRIGLIHPTFDNIASILRRHDIELTPIEEGVLKSDPKSVERLNLDGLFLVCPNNPTGYELSPKALETIAGAACRQNRVLVVDFSFRWFGQSGHDHYDLLRKAGVKFLAIEDTGKALPTLELKLGLLASSEHFIGGVRSIHNDLVLGVSPFALALNGELLRGTRGAKFLDVVKSVVAKNRDYLAGVCEDAELTIVGSSGPSVAWVQLPEDWDSSDLCAWLRDQKVHVLPGGPFFWADRQRGRSWIRVALMRPSVSFQHDASVLAHRVKEYAKAWRHRRSR